MNQFRCRISEESTQSVKVSYFPILLIISISERQILGVLLQSRNLSGLSDSELDELIWLLDDYQPVLETSITKWKQLGSHPKADRF